jgi:hypothetical protein
MKYAIHGKDKLIGLEISEKPLKRAILVKDKGIDFKRLK